MANKMMIGGGVAVLVSCLVYVILTLVSLNCAADGKWDCAQGTGITAAVSGCMCASAVAVLVYISKE